MSNSELNSKRVPAPSEKVKENLEINQELVDEFWRVIDVAKTIPPKDKAANQKQILDIKFVYDKLKKALGDVVPAEFRLAADRAMASLQQRDKPCRSLADQDDVRSEKSRESQASSTSTLRLRLKVERAELEAEKAKLRVKEMELHMERMKQEMEEERWRMEVKFRDIAPAKEMDPKPLNPNVPAFIPAEPAHSHAASGKTDIEELAAAINSSLSLSRLPAPEPAVFTGDPLQYTKWKLTFKNLIEGKNLNNAEKLFYLQRYLGGSALRATEGFFFSSSTESYEGAWKLLEERYGHSFKIQEAFRDRLSSWPRIRNNNSSELLEYADFLRACAEAMCSVPGLSVLNDCKENQRLASKLPDFVSGRWNRIVTEKLQERHQYPEFRAFVDFVVKEAQIANNPVTSFSVLKGIDSHPRKGTKDKSHVLATSAQSGQSTSGSAKPSHTSSVQASQHKESEMRKDRCCKYCKGNDHYLSTCAVFESKPIQERKQFVQQNKLCFGCLRAGHFSKECKIRHTCKTCKRKHPSVMHNQENSPAVKNDEKTRLEEKSNEHSSISCKTRSNSDRTTMIVPVWLGSQNSSEVLTYAMLDNQSDTSFITEDLASKLKMTGSAVKLNIKTVTSPQAASETSTLFNNLEVRGMHQVKKIVIPKCYSRQCIPYDNSQIPTGDMAEEWPYLKHLSQQIPKLQDCEVGLLLGTNCPAAGLPREVICNGDNEPYAVRTDLGWSIINGVEAAVQHSRFCHRIKTRESPVISPREVLAILEYDFADTATQSGRCVSQHDLKFLNILEREIKMEDGHLMMPLPFKNEAPVLPDNKQMALARLSHLKKKLERNQRYREQYVTFVEDVIFKGEAEEVKDQGAPGKVWYIPHHGVTHPRKPDKLRVVFDCSARIGAESLNSHLLTGPDLLNNLTGVLLRFRQHQVAVQADVERMFHQFLVRPEDRDYLRFFWWEKGELETKPKEYRMKVHLFGAGSSPGCCNYGMKHLAKESATKFPQAAEFVNKNFYMDDGLQSCATEEEAITLVRESQELCKQANIRLHKFISNSEKVLDSIDASERADSEKGKLDLRDKQLSTEMALGVRWDVKKDIFTFPEKHMTQPPTRRGILSAVASIFDPLGYIAPHVLKGKILLQEMCRIGVNWDDKLSEHLLQDWEQWKENCAKLNEICIPRCFKSADFGTVMKTELHHFADASNVGYGQCSYIRLVGENHVHCALLFGKSRVAPLKVTTIPRLELTAAVVASLVSEKIKSELDIPVDEEYFWTDSQITLSYINNDTKRFHVFVANRIEKIKQLSRPEQWLHVATQDNPADIASRGGTISDLIKSSWFKGPTFLWNVTWKPEQQTMPELAVGDPEVKSCTLETICEKEKNILDRLNVYSSWTSVLRVIARLRRCAKRRICGNGPATCQERLEAESIIIRAVQQISFSKEIHDLKNGQIKSNSALFNLNPFLDSENVLRVGGRLNKAALPDVVKHPAILPKRSHVTSLVVKHFHEKTLHQGRGITLNELRANGYWVLGSTRVIQSYIKGCVTCRKMRRATEEQKMADLPTDRTDPSPPFIFTGMDCFGPFIVKRVRKEVKRYGIIFTCLSCRAVHIEMLEDLSTDCFLNALRCFIAVRGAVKELRCDQGTNFVGASNEIKQALKELDVDRLEVYLAERQCQFIMNAPGASHAGGIWERQIRTIRSVLTGTLQLCPGRLDDSSLRTFLYEAMAVINSRPLSVISLNDPNAPEALTPNHLLMMKSSHALPPPGTFVKEDMFATKRWRRVQYLTEVFWGRWKREYLVNLNQRQKWSTARRNVMVGDIVMIVEESKPRMEWSLAKVKEAEPDEDGLVRRVKILVGTKCLDKHGMRSTNLSVLERPVQKLVVLLEANTLNNM